MHVRHVLLTSLAGLMLIVLAACGGSGGSSPTDTTGRYDDARFDEARWAD